MNEKRISSTDAAILVGLVLAVALVLTPLFVGLFGWLA